MEKFGKSQPVRRVEDVRFLTGQGRYVDDIVPEEALFAFFLRSSVAHGEISELDLDAARGAEGVHLVLTAEDLEAAGIDIAMPGIRMDNRDGSKGAGPRRPALAVGRVRHVGEPVACIVADTLEQARDAAELIGLEIDELPAKLDLHPGGETVHAEAPDNMAYDYGVGDEAATQAAFDAAAQTVSLEITDNRIIANSMEPRG
ncbi:MAG: xanthine dehydrogenase family protein molybdopterin-binding subunit, partial [Pseudooceanicola sp.]|nr:xanthine dehydrogenase family protein molybdopterin-binding subunit [Pseudooceanicola sp.]